MRLGLLGEVEQRLGAARSRSSASCSSGPGALAGAELAAIAARRAVAEAMRFDQHDIGARLGEVSRRRQAGEATADDHDIRFAVAIERWIGWAIGNRILIPGTAGRNGGLIRHGRLVCTEGIGAHLGIALSDSQFVAGQPDA